MAPLQRVPLRLPAELRAEVEALRGDRVLNTCLIRAIEQWVVRERALREATVLGLYEDGSPVRVASAPAPAKVPRMGGAADANGDAHAGQVDGQGQAAASGPDPAWVDEDLDNPAEVQEDLGVDEPRRRRPPASAEQWGDVGGDA